MFVDVPSPSSRITILDDLIAQNLPTYRNLFSDFDVDKNRTDLKVLLTSNDFVVPPLFATTKRFDQICRVPYLFTSDDYGLPLASSNNALCAVPAALFFVFDATFAMSSCSSTQGLKGEELSAVSICRHFFGTAPASAATLDAALKKVGAMMSSRSTRSRFQLERVLPHESQIDPIAGNTLALFARDDVLLILFDSNEFCYRYSSECRWWFYDASRTEVPVHHRHVQIRGSLLLRISKLRCIAFSGHTTHNDFMISEDALLEEVCGPIPRCPAHSVFLRRVNAAKRRSAACAACGSNRVKWMCSAQVCTMILCKTCRAPDVLAHGPQSTAPGFDKDLGDDSDSSDYDDTDLVDSLEEEHDEPIPLHTDFLSDGSDDASSSDDAPRASVPLLLVAAPALQLSRQGRTHLNLHYMNCLTALLNTLKSPTPLPYLIGALFPMHYITELRGLPCRTVPLSRLRDTVFLDRVGLPKFAELLYLFPRQLYLSTTYDLSFLSFLHELKINVEMENMDNRPSKVHEFHDIEIVHKRAKDVLPMSETEVYTWLRRMEGFLRVHKRFNIFHTTTCNFAETPGMVELSSLIRENGMPEGPFVVQRVLQWFRFQKYYVEWAFTSPFSPISGPESHFIARCEWQTTSSGNLPHLHCGLCNGKSQEENAGVIESDIRRMFDFVKDTAERDSLEALARRVLPHNCLKAGSRCMKMRSDGTTYCRVRRYDLSSRAEFRDKIITVPQEHAQLLKSMDRLDHMTCGYWTYSSQGRGYAVSPIVAKLFAITRSSSNTLATDGTLVESSYLAGYILGQEERGIVKIFKRPGSTEMKVPRLHAAKKRRRDHSEQQASSLRVLSMTECVWSLLGLPFVHTSCDFSEMHMGFPINRVSRKFKVKTSQRHHHSPECCEPAPQQLSLWKTICSNFRTVNRSDYFDLRPPCLISAFRNAVDFMTCCVVRKNSSTKKSSSYNSTCGLRLLDGSHLLFFRSALCFTLERLEAAIPFCRSITSIIDSVKNLNKRFVAEGRNTVPFWRPVLPRSKAEFLYFMIKRFGNYDFEFDIALQGIASALISTHCLEAFDNAGVTRLLQRFFDEELKFWSRGTRDKLSTLSLARDVLLDVLDGSHGDHASSVAPLDSLHETADQQFQQLLESVLLPTEQLRTSVPDLPDAEDSNFEVNAVLPTVHGDEAPHAVAQQNIVLNHLRTCIRKKEVIRLLLLGPPGAGKSWLTFALAAQLHASGFRAIAATTISTLRARSIGGLHAHALFRLKVGCNFSLHKEAASTLASLDRDAPLKKVLRYIDVLILEEISTFTARQLYVIDFLLQKVRQNDAPFGGIHVIANGDPFQLTVDGITAPWHSLHFLASFTPVCLRFLIRSLCSDQTRILNSLRHQEHDPAVSFAIAEDIVDHVTLLEADEISTCNLPFILPTQESLRAAQDKARRCDPDSTFTNEAYDVVLLPTGTTRSPRSTEMKQIDKACGMHRTVTLRKSSPAKVTMNLHDLNLPNGSYVVVEDVHLIGNEIKSVQVSFGSTLHTFKLHEEQRYVKLANRTITVRRKQFPLQLNVGDTIHSYQGATLAGSITLLGDTPKGYALWNKEQLISLLGRTRRLCDTHLASPFGSTLNKQSIVRVLVEAIATPAMVPDQFMQWAETHDMLQTSVHENGAAIRTILFPEKGSCVCYLIYSARRRSLHEKDFYWGSTNNMMRRLRRHNGLLAGGAQLTLTGRPWKLFAWIEGFQHYNDSLRFELNVARLLEPLTTTESAVCCLEDTIQAEPELRLLRA